MQPHPPPNRINHTQASKPLNPSIASIPKSARPSPNHNSAIKENPSGEHLVEVIGRICDYPNRKNNSILQIYPHKQTFRVHEEFGFRYFNLDEVSPSEDEGLASFYKKFVESRINRVKLGVSPDLGGQRTSSAMPRAIEDTMMRAVVFSVFLL
ncbi:hypothetical protein NL676_022739 [Syzygium grande]|nr:hypothetical protein NL676_022739 [Syzygium grande]